MGWLAQLNLNNMFTLSEENQALMGLHDGSVMRAFDTVLKGVNDMKKKVLEKRAPPGFAIQTYDSIWQLLTALAERVHSFFMLRERIPHSTAGASAHDIKLSKFKSHNLWKTRQTRLKRQADDPIGQLCCRNKLPSNG